MLEYVHECVIMIASLLSHPADNADAAALLVVCFSEDSGVDHLQCSRAGCNTVRFEWQ